MMWMGSSSRNITVHRHWVGIIIRPYNVQVDMKMHAWIFDSTVACWLRKGKRAGKVTSYIDLEGDNDLCIILVMSICVRVAAERYSNLVVIQ